MSTNRQAVNKELVLRAFDTLFNKRDYDAAATYWSENYIQHSAHIEPGRDGLFNLIKAAPATMKYEAGVIVGRWRTASSCTVASPATDALARGLRADILRVEDGKLAEHWDVLQFEATREESKSGLPMFGTMFAE